jgi:hypothetical protein
MINKLILNIKATEPKHNLHKEKYILCIQNRQSYICNNLSIYTFDVHKYDTIFIVNIHETTFLFEVRINVPFIHNLQHFGLYD